MPPAGYQCQAAVGSGTSDGGARDVGDRGGGAETRGAVGVVREAIDAR
jgi:hypothetical protein